MLSHSSVALQLTFAKSFVSQTGVPAWWQLVSTSAPAHGSGGSVLADAGPVAVGGGVNGGGSGDTGIVTS